MINETINYAIKLKEEYAGNINMLLKDNSIKIFKDPNIDDILAYTVKMRGKDVIVINPYLEEVEYNFVLCHELYHILKHDDCSRCFSEILNNDRFELEANIFAVSFLELGYIDDISKVSKTINNTLVSMNKY